MGRLVPPFPSSIPSLLLRPGAPDRSPAGPVSTRLPQGVRRTLPLLITPSIINSGRCLHNEGCIYSPSFREGSFSETQIHTPAYLIRYRGVGKRAGSASFLEEFFSETQQA